MKSSTAVSSSCRASDTSVSRDDMSKGSQDQSVCHHIIRSEKKRLLSSMCFRFRASINRNRAEIDTPRQAHSPFLLLLRSRPQCQLLFLLVVPSMDKQSLNGIADASLAVKAERIAHACEQKDIEALIELATSEHGLLEDGYRRRACE